MARSSAFDADHEKNNRRKIVSLLFYILTGSFSVKRKNGLAPYSVGLLQYFPKRTQLPMWFFQIRHVRLSV